MTIEEKVKKLISDQMGVVDPKTLTLKTSIVDDLAADSLDLVELEMEIEDEFAIEISQEDAAGMKTVSDIIELIRKKVQDL